MFEKVKETYKHHGLALATMPSLPTEEELNFRLGFLNEEVEELSEAFDDKNIVGMADAIADIIIVAMGLAATMGLPLTQILEAVNNANYTGKRKVTSAAESKRNYSEDLKKTLNFVSPEAEIERILSESQLDNIL